MIQTNAKSNFGRQLRKESYGQVAAPQPPVAASPPPRTEPQVIKATGFHGVKAQSDAVAKSKTRLKTRLKTRTKVSAAKSNGPDAADGDKPADLVDEPTLILFSGQLLQISKQRPDGWVFGSVVLDTNCPDGRPTSGAEGFSSSAGWFPLEKTDVASTEQLAQLQKSLGGSGKEASDALKPPATWQQMKDPMVVENFALKESAEKQQVMAAFMKTLPPNVKVQSVERVQSMSMWQSVSLAGSNRFPYPNVCYC